jgi:prepilin-type N-terminal cleavage/methylation domain-containing protein
MKKKFTQSGFTLIEAMVAISILSIAVTGPLIIAQKGISSALYARDEVTAFYLAQEAIEYVRNVRDTNRIWAVPWLNSNLSRCEDTGSNERCQIDARYASSTSQGAITVCPLGVCPPLSFGALPSDPLAGFYGYPVSGDGYTWSPTKFTRTIFMDTGASPKEAVISVSISWKTTLFNPTRTFTVKEYIFDF